MTAKIYVQTNGHIANNAHVEALKVAGCNVVTTSSNAQIPQGYYDHYFYCVETPHEFHQYAKKLTPSLNAKTVFLSTTHFPVRTYGEVNGPTVQWEVVGTQWDGVVVEHIIQKYIAHKNTGTVTKTPGFVNFETPSTASKNFYNEYQKGIMHTAQISASAIVVTGEKGVGKRHITENIVRTYLPDHDFYKVCLEQIGSNAEKVDQVLFGSASESGCLESVGTGFVYIQEAQLLPKATQERLASCLTHKQINHTTLQGEQVAIPLGCHVVISSSEDIEFLARSGKFAPQLLQIAGSGKYEVPHLTSRPEDITSLAEQMIDYLNKVNSANCDGLSDGAIAGLQQYPWPHNTEELYQCMQVVVRPNFAGNVQQHHIPDQFKPRGKTKLNDLLPTSPVPYQLAKKNVMDYFNDYYAHFLLRHTEFNFSAAARLAGMDRSNFRRLFKEYLGDHYSKDTGDDQETTTAPTTKKVA